MTVSKSGKEDGETPGIIDEKSPFERRTIKNVFLRSLVFQQGNLEME